MSAPCSECPVRLHRDALNTPWGFRLQGGKDFKAPLSVQRVFVGSPADGDLHRGDILVAIDNFDANHLTHKQAQDIIKNAGGSLSLRIRRGAGYADSAKPITFGAHVATGPPTSSSQYRSRPLDSIVPKPTPPIGAFSPKTGTGMQGGKFGTDYGSGQFNRPMTGGTPGGMLQKVNNSLNQSIWSHEDNQEVDYEHKPIGEIQKIFTQGAPPQHTPAYAQTGSTYTPVRRQPWRKPHTDGSALQEPGWTPKPKPVHAPFRAPQSAPVPVNRPSPTQQYQQQQQHHQRPSGGSRPPWSGSLRSSGGPKPWEIIAGENLVPGGGGEVYVPTGPSSIPRQAAQSGTYQPQQHQQQPMGSPNVQPHNPRVQNVHYGPGGPQYQQLSPRAADPDNAKLVHAQYNSPMGLYSRENAQAALDGQSTGKPGEGTMQISGGGQKKPFNPAQSDVYRLLQEEEEIAGQRHQQQQQQQRRQQHHGAHPDQSARYQEHQPGQEMHYVGYVDPSTKSPSMMALEAQVVDEGTSDF